MHIEVHKVDQGAVHVHHVPHVQGQALEEVQEGHSAFSANFGLKGSFFCSFWFGTRGRPESIP
jgi:hypothetical protein